MFSPLQGIRDNLADAMESATWTPGMLPLRPSPFFSNLLPYSDISFQRLPKAEGLSIFPFSFGFSDFYFCYAVSCVAVPLAPSGVVFFLFPFFSISKLFLRSLYRGRIPSFSSL